MKNYHYYMRFNSNLYRLRCYIHTVSAIVGSELLQIFTVLSNLEILISKSYPVDGRRQSFIKLSMLGDISYQFSLDLIDGFHILVPGIELDSRETKYNLTKALMRPWVSWTMQRYNFGVLHHISVLRSYNFCCKK